MWGFIPWRSCGKASPRKPWSFLRGHWPHGWGSRGHGFKFRPSRQSGIPGSVAIATVSWILLCQEGAKRKFKKAPQNLEKPSSAATRVAAFLDFTIKLCIRTAFLLLAPVQAPLTRKCPRGLPRPGQCSLFHKHQQGQTQ